MWMLALIAASIAVLLLGWFFLESDIGAIGPVGGGLSVVILPFVLVPEIEGLDHATSISAAIFLGLLALGSSLYRLRRRHEPPPPPRRQLHRHEFG